MDANLRPILSALRRNKSGAILIGLQIALTLAIVCNALFIIEQRWVHMAEPSGVDEADLTMIGNLWMGRPDIDVPKLAAADLQTIRQTPGVVDAYGSGSYPLQGGGWDEDIILTPDQPQKTGVHSSIYFVDEHAIHALGTHLIAGRDFRPDEIDDFSDMGVVQPPVVIISAALAGQLFPGSSALGKPLYLTSASSASVVVGVVDLLHASWTASKTGSDALNSVLVPLREVKSGSHFTYFIVRTQPGQRDSVVKSVIGRLHAADRLRTITSQRSFEEARAAAYRNDHSLAILLGIVSAVLLLVTAAGIVGLASFWVGQRHRQIGIRRALGARQRDILGYFLAENLMITVVAVLIGGVASILLNLWLVERFEMSRMPLLYVIGGAALMLLLGQLAAFAPARRASRVPPVVATRAV